jgi:5,10-methylenetetrahydrofolate reductase
VSFRLIYELGVPREPDLKKVLLQLEIFGPVVDAFLIPDNHLGLPALSSVALAVEVRNQGLKPIAAVNARDRNHLRFRSDVMTLKAYGVDEVLFLYGDNIDHGRSGLKVREMLGDEAAGGLRKGVAAEIGKPLGWKSRADFLMTQLAFERSQAGYWREANGFSQPLYCGVIALPNKGLAHKYLSNIPDMRVPEGYLASFDKDEEAGLSAAIAELDGLCVSGVDGAHLVVPARWRRFAQLLEEWKESKGLNH